MSERDLLTRIKDLEEGVEALEQRERDRETQQLKWALRVLGGVVVAMATWIWSQVGGIFDLGGNR